MLSASLVYYSTRVLVIIYVAIDTTIIAMSFYGVVASFMLEADFTGDSD